MTLPLRRFTGTVFRGHHPMWAFEPTSGEGARRFGGRFNPKNVPTLYTALRPSTAWAEVQAGFAFKLQPATLCAYEVDCTDVLDLTTTDGRASCDAALDDLNRIIASSHRISLMTPTANIDHPQFLRPPLNAY
jgi:RES domain-containing protein